MECGDGGGGGSALRSRNWWRWREGSVYANLVEERGTPSGTKTLNPVSMDGEDSGGGTGDTSTYQLCMERLDNLKLAVLQESRING
ncbi:hypothetical protein E2C01_014655 [Portunus trituberculatus]|uniref:Uncharacterized protein n=1 Tax=Portunus trituberculatus TaxID=210409 RepID=A0A5B7DKK9_PORTR|nr:hypothetical protein [Portunus trituberculatus]